MALRAFRVSLELVPWTGADPGWKEEQGGEALRKDWAVDGLPE